MINQDTVKLLRECDSGVKMGISAIDDVMAYVKSNTLKGILQDTMSESQRLKDDLQIVLENYHDQGKEPNPMAKGMSWVKTNMKLKMDESDSTVAELMIDGCNMGIKSLSRYLNQYKNADSKSKSLAGKLVSSEEKLSSQMRQFL